MKPVHHRLATLLLLIPCALAAQSVRVVHEPRAEEPAPASSGVVVYVDPETGRFLDAPPAGVQRSDFPELRSDPSRVQEELRPDGTLLTWLNGQGIEAQVLVPDAAGRPSIRCTGLSEGGVVGRHGDLRFAADNARTDR